MGLGGRLSRSAALGGLSARTAAGWALGAVARRVGGSGPAERLQSAAAARVAGRLGELKGLAMKVGQVLSFVSPDVPEELREALAALQTTSPPRPFAEIAATLERALGMPLAAAFRSVDPVPVAAASIGQVHRALLPDGAPVAVKVQYADVAAAVRADLANVSLLLQPLGLLLPGLDPREVARELRARFGEELDYVAEARHQAAFAAWFEGHPFIAVPRVVPERSAATVLTSEYVEGGRFAEILREGEEARSRFGEILFRFLLGSVFGLGTVDGDPHPGNYLFDPGGRRVTFLDFGCVKRLPAPLRDGWRAFQRALLEEDRAAARSLAERLGYVDPGGGSAGDAVVDALSRLFVPFDADDSMPFPPPVALARLGEAGQALLELRGGLRVPSELLFVTRATAGMYMVLARLGAVAPWRLIAREYACGGAPATALGEEERAWAGRVGHAPAARGVRAGGA